MKKIFNKKSLKKVLRSIASAQKSAYLPLCPRCGRESMLCTSDSKTFSALSRRADIYVCDNCGVTEAMEDYLGVEKLPLSEWALFGASSEDLE